MTLEQTTRLILSAAKLQDLDALQTAWRERQAAIAGLRAMPPTEQLRQDLAGSIAAGEEAKRTLRLIKQRIRGESRRLERIDAGFVRALRPTKPHRIDCHG